MSAEKSAGEPSTPEMRRKHHLRGLVDEMMASIRDAANQELWKPEERAKYEQELAEIMARVRAEATAGATEPPAT
ncbi:MAG: hypothetical protein ABJD07_03760 [Gemmatimonadaceae bacterium]